MKRVICGKAEELTGVEVGGQDAGRLVGPHAVHRPLHVGEALVLVDRGFLAGVQGLPEQDPHPPLVVRGPLEVVRQPLLQRAREGGADLVEALGHGLHRGVEQSLLAAEMPVQELLVDLGPPGDPVDAGAGQPVLDELLDGCFQDPVRGGGMRRTDGIRGGHGGASRENWDGM
jgi:hypothetical protein